MGLFQRQPGIPATHTIKLDFPPGVNRHRVYTGPRLSLDGAGAQPVLGRLLENRTLQAPLWRRADSQSPEPIR